MTALKYLSPGWEERSSKDGWVYYFIQHETYSPPLFLSLLHAPLSLCPFPNSHINKGKTYFHPRQAFTGSNTAALEILQGCNLSDRVVLITGGNSGIGEFSTTAKSFALHGAHVILACINFSKASKAVSLIQLFIHLHIQYTP
uniref:WW domain-containing oxidoreductase n=1 Tax=Salmo trutta TaxID=8032 RepID=A0A674DF08_SALTR